MPNVSVIMPVYNVEQYVAVAIESVLTQSYSDFELLIIIDGATDGSLAICQQFNDARIRIIEQANRGLAGARNTGIRAAQGQYLAFLDSDDYWLPKKLAQQVAHLDNSPKIGVSYCVSEFIDEQGNSLNLFMRPKFHDISKADVFCRNPVGNGSVPMIRKAAFEAIGFSHTLHDTEETAYFDETFRQSEDIECWMRIALLTPWKFEGIEETLVQYRVSAGGLSANLEQQYAQWQRMVEKMRDYAPTFLQQWEATSRAYQLRYLARRAVRMRDGRVATRLMHQALRSDKSLLWQEPARTLVSLFAAWLLALLPSGWYARMEKLAISYLPRAKIWHKNLMLPHVPGPLGRSRSRWQSIWQCYLHPPLILLLAVLPRLLDIGLSILLLCLLFPALLLRASWAYWRTGAVFEKHILIGRFQQPFQRNYFASQMLGRNTAM
ncbi:glycosyltransferase family 2 protein [Candidatus Halobeggiatoa sp. HSG11]|nr:glycosyltransferase family 2 protein [Candidatus Halobeggiatoa sp. HSG11]